MGLLKRDEAEPEGPKPLDVEVNPNELEQLQACQVALEKAVEFANRVPDEVNDPESKSMAADALKFLRDALKDNDNARLEIGRLFTSAKDRVNAAFKEIEGKPKGVFESIEQRVLEGEEQERERQAAERREAEEAARKAEEEARASEDAAAERRAREELDRAQAPKVEPTGARGMSGAKASPTAELKYEITDPELLPDKYVERVPRKSVILADVRQGLAIPGVRPYRDKKVRVK